MPFLSLKKEVSQMGADEVLYLAFAIGPFLACILASVYFSVVIVLSLRRRETVSDFRKGFAITGIPIVFLSWLEMSYGFTGIIVLFWGLAIVYCGVAIILTPIFFAVRGKRRLVKGMLTGTPIGIFAIIWMTYVLFPMD